MKKPLTGRKYLLLVVLLALTGVLPGRKRRGSLPIRSAKNSLMAAMHAISTLTLYDYVKELSLRKI